jgi:hypothetical protein
LFGLYYLFCLYIHFFIFMVLAFILINLHRLLFFFCFISFDMVFKQYLYLFIEFKVLKKRIYLSYNGTLP